MADREMPPSSPLTQILIEEYRRELLEPPAADEPGRAPAPPSPLYQVLVEEYRRQGTEPPIDPVGADFVEELLAEAVPRIAAAYRSETEQSGGADEGGAARPSAATELEREQRIRDDVAEEGLAAFFRFLHTKGVKRAALCLSGGGIRSATFGLGVVQGLARWGLLSRFDFLSTVSGGGYLGSWLSAWIHRTAKALGGDGAAALAAVERQLASAPKTPLEPEPEPIRQLRSYTRYMSPRAGFLSADTWTLVGIFLRNLTLNWLVLLPLIAAALMFPRLSTALLRLVSEKPPADQLDIMRWVLGAATLLGAVVVGYFTASRPSLTEVDPPRSRLPKVLRSQGWFLGLGLLPLWLLAVGATAFWAWTDLHFYFFGREIKQHILVFALFGAAIGVGGYLVSRLAVWEWAPLELVSLLGTGALGGLFTWVAAFHFFPNPHDMPDAELYICFGAPILLLLFLAAATIFVGVASKLMDDADREWMARAGSWILILIVARAGLSAVVIFGPWALERSSAIGLSSLGGISGLVTLFLGNSARTAPERKPGEARTAMGIAKSVALGLAAPTFAAFLLVLLSIGTSLLVVWAGNTFFPAQLDVDFHAGEHLTGDRLELMNAVHYAPWWLVLAVAGGLLLLGAGMGLVVNINRFSLHAAYRDRLIRAYLGASRSEDERHPNPFTGFDAADNLAMTALAGNRPLPVLNLTLNLVHGRKLAWQDRKAEPFSVSPLRCGSYVVGYRRAAEYAYSKTAEQAITLGTALAISGAAASPNMGYHSSPAVTFLMTLFNVRLGWWLGNPRLKTYRKSGPLFAPRPLFAEAFGLTDDENPYVYLSDGGHFENLGLYEMVLRRCRWIVVSDAGEDAGFDFSDLGGAIAKIRIDLGVPILFQKILMRPRDPQRSYDLTRSGDQAPYAAIGRICYSCADRLEGDRPLDPDDDGWLIYVKASLNGSESVDVYNYAKAHPTFPHESTANQLYTEAQFESYRELGSHAVETLCSGLKAGDGLAELAALLRKAQGEPPPCQPEASKERPSPAQPPGQPPDQPPSQPTE